jgi:hypothetical protein
MSNQTTAYGKIKKELLSAHGRRPLNKNYRILFQRPECFKTRNPQVNSS